MRFISVLLLSAGIVFAQGIEVVEGEGWHYVKVSLTDINRISCPVEIGQVVYSKEKEIEVKRSGPNAYVKFLPKVMPDGKTEIESFPRELYVECGDKVFQLVLLPEKIPAVHITLKLPRASVERAREYEKSSPYDSMMLELVGSVYREEPPEGYEVKVINSPYSRFAELDMVLYREYTGGRYVVQEFILQAKMDVELWEGQFLPYLEKPLAIAIVKPILKAGESTRLIVVRRRDA